MSDSNIQEQIERDGYHLLKGAFSAAECDAILATWQAKCLGDAHGIMRNARGEVVGARNLLTLWPEIASLTHQPGLMRSIRGILGQEIGLVRALYFDKPPGDSWALPWHKDMAIAVRDNRSSSSHFTHPTQKYGVAHVEAPEWLLAQMLTARIHLDEVNEENGPLRVAPGSHRGGKQNSACADPVHVLSGKGDVLLIRPLVSHASGHCKSDATGHRRILHLEFSPITELPDGYCWNWFIRLSSDDVAAERVSHPSK